MMADLISHCSVSALPYWDYWHKFKYVQLLISNLVSTERFHPHVTAHIGTSKQSTNCHFIYPLQLYRSETEGRSYPAVISWEVIQKC